MRPTKRLLYLLLAWWLAAIALGILDHYSSTVDIQLVRYGWWALGVTLLLVSLLDGLVGRNTDCLKVLRDLPLGMSVGSNNPFAITLINKVRRNIKLRLTELCDETVVIRGLPLELKLKGKERLKINLDAHPVKRGSTPFMGVDTLLETRLGLWASRKIYLEPVEVKVFPNFTAISHFELLAHGRQVGQLGIHLHQRRGEGLDFHQLREYRPGDSLRQVDWKATSKAHKPISREFQEERDQDIIFLLDNGRRMRSKGGELSYFDHCLNSFLLTAYVALRQGDAVGLQVFGDSDRWVNPVKGKNNLTTLLHQVYDLHSSLAVSDYLSAAQKLMDKHRKRSLIVIVTNIGDQDGDDLLMAHRLLSNNHLVLFACLRETMVDKQIEEPVEDFMQALSYSSAMEYSQQRQSHLKQLASLGAIIIDDLPSRLHIALVNVYLDLKRSGRI